MIQQFTNFSDVNLSRSCVTIGAFDGLHLGHRRLLENAYLYSLMWKIPAVVITFDPIPSVYFNPEKSQENIMTHEEKASFLDELGFSHLLTLNFDQDLAEKSADDFMQQVFDSLHPQAFWVGEGFSLGKDCGGTTEYLHEIAVKHQCHLRTVPRLEIDGEIVSSTHIRTLLKEGSMQEANKLLGYEFGFTSQVIHGDGRGHELGFPTVNMLIPEEKIIPAYGVYATELEIGGKVYPAVTNVGERPTFKTDHQVDVESFILKDGRDFYGEKAEMRFVEFLRSERKFGSIEELQKAVEKNIIQAKNILHVA